MRILFWSVLKRNAPDYECEAYAYRSEYDPMNPSLVGSYGFIIRFGILVKKRKIWFRIKRNPDLEFVKETTNQWGVVDFL